MKNIKMRLSAIKEPREAVHILNLDDIDFSTESQDDLVFLAESITSYINLTQISLRRSQLGSTKTESLQRFFDAIQQHPRLSSLTLTDAVPKMENVELVQSFARCLAGSRLQNLELDHNQVNEQFLATIISANKNLKMLSINNIGLENWNEAAMRLLCDAIVDSSLEALFMSQNGLGRLDCLPMLGEAISHSRTLTTLSVADNNIGENDKAEDFLIKISGLKYLDLSFNALANIGPEGWESFISTLISKPQIVELDISNNELGLIEEFLNHQEKSFLVYLDKLNKEIPSLKKLDSSNNGFEDIFRSIKVALLHIKLLSPEEKARLKPDFERAFKDPTPPPSASQFFVSV